MQNDKLDDVRQVSRQQTEVKAWIYRQEYIRKMIYMLFAACVAVISLDLLYENEHPHFELETFFGFQAWLGFIAFVVVVFLGRLLRIFVGRPENYYD